ncbi:DUF1839 family protein [Burkholderia sp. FERM BP-3421]|jgi:Domain of unknown function (DUF1839)|uniref:DUF1839 family protein n=1 Tax=Burkholderia sp. FERM BP-3421 TaxID=1494466 RepID=UPI00235FA92D|nr:DUF1839 family protein [Burkholderia sp. FERM BP-3421]WDD95306.1 DUF1839 family protein [Burkholderia sp. FERM BP-3421]
MIRGALDALPGAPPGDAFADIRHRARHYRPHPLHGPQMVWKQSNCYVDLWIEVLGWWGLNPYAALPFTVGLDFEGDQFTFFKFPLEDLETLYGIVVQEHAIFESVDVHVERQVARGNLMLVEVDAWHLPDTRGATYQAEHAKTTIGIDAIDRAQRQIGYFHNNGYYLAEGADYDGLFDASSPARLLPYVERAARRFDPLPERALCDASLELLAWHLKRRPAHNPITAFRRQFAIDAHAIATRPLGYFHAYSFNTVRQLGANFELLGRYLRWLEASGCGGPFESMVATCDTIASESMVLEFRLARASARGKVERGDSSLDILERAYATLVDQLGALTPPSRHDAASPAGITTATQ